MSGPRLAVLVSGSGTTLQNMIDRIADGRMHGEIVLIVSSATDAVALERAKRHEISAEVVDAATADPEPAFSDRITELVDASGADLVCMAGFLRLWRFPERWEGRVMNIHPALLPSFGGTGMYGPRVHEAVLASGVKVSGCTVHFASHVYDEGPVILQRIVPVYFEDRATDLARRVFAEECEAYPEAIRLFAAGRLRIEDGRVQVLPT